MMTRSNFHIKALVFDFDGLILETEEPVFRAWQNLYASFGVEMPLDLWQSTIGSSDADWHPLNDLKQKLDWKPDWEKLLEQRSRVEMQMVLDQPILPGVITVLESARRLGLKTAVASSSSRQWVEGHLQRLGLLEYFDCLRTSEDVQRTKPDPELFVQAIQALGVEPQETVVFEDSANGILASKRAGAWCVAVPTVMTRKMPLKLADLRLDSLADLPLEGLLEVLEEVANQAEVRGD